MSQKPEIETTQAGAILAWLRQREDEMADLLAELVGIPTENPPGKNYRACANLLEIRLRESGLDCERLAPEDSKKDRDDAPI
jgi:succinyl-diaminopimelate desuccinylase